MTAVSVAYALQSEQFASFVLVFGVAALIVWRVCGNAKVGQRADAIRRRLDDLAEVIGR